MYFSKHVATVLFLAATTATFAGAVDIEDIAALKFEGKCTVLTNPDHVIGHFSLDPFKQKHATLKAVEVDSFGNDVVTDVNVHFQMFDSLAIFLATNLTDNLAGNHLSSSVGNPTVGVNVRSTMPLKLGGKVSCEGVVVSTKKGE